MSMTMPRNVITAEGPSTFVGEAGRPSRSHKLSAVRRFDLHSVEPAGAQNR